MLTLAQTLSPWKRLNRGLAVTLLVNCVSPVSKSSLCLTIAPMYILHFRCCRSTHFIIPLYSQFCVGLLFVCVCMYAYSLDNKIRFFLWVRLLHILCVHLFYYVGSWYYIKNGIFTSNITICVWKCFVYELIFTPSHQHPITCKPTRCITVIAIFC